ncbi:hypothetical protein pdam_00005462 [Pocillopora damicornis]|uniref:Uncharacterized protein n=1 Tax=Pocillopora damicornis TaxID=46731 RepID=A0A3M6U3I6_POCDA|nr:hypothetical protein pdam_00005462 [Pocillopora damicornis]
MVQKKHREGIWVQSNREQNPAMSGWVEDSNLERPENKSSTVLPKLLQDLNVLPLALATLLNIVSSSLRVCNGLLFPRNLDPLSLTSGNLDPLSLIPGGPIVPLICGFRRLAKIGSVAKAKQSLAERYLLGLFQRMLNNQQPWMSQSFSFPAISSIKIVL